MSDEEFQAGDSGASQTDWAQASSIKKGGLIMLKGKPCKVVDYSSSKPGKHGAAKIHFVGIDIFTGKKHEEIISSTSNAQTPICERNEYQVVDIDGDFLSLMSEDGNCRDDVKIPVDDVELTESIRTPFANDEQVAVCVMSGMGQERVVSAKTI